MKQYFILAYVLSGSWSSADLQIAPESAAHEPHPRTTSNVFPGPPASPTSLPKQYAEQKTPVLFDLVIVGFVLFFCILAFSFYVAFPGIRGSEKIFAYIRFTVSIAIGAFILVCNYGQSWEVAQVQTYTQYKASDVNHVKAEVGVYIGLRGINVTLTGLPVKQQGETIDYNERFSWEWGQGRRGFGSRAGRFNREFRAAQLKGLPYPILWVAEYFTFDGEGIRFGRHYRLAGWYAHILIWMAFPLWLLTNILLFMVIQYGAVSLLLTGISLLASNIVFASIRNPIPLEIPFEDGKLVFTYGWSFWLIHFTGLACCLLGVVIFFADLRFPDQTAAFFGISFLQEYEDFYADPREFSKDANKGVQIDTNKVPSVEVSESEQRQTPVYAIRRRTLSVRFQKSGRKKPAIMPRTRYRLQVSVSEPEDEPVYENVAMPRFDAIGEEGSVNESTDKILMKDYR